MSFMNPMLMKACPRCRQTHLATSQCDQRLALQELGRCLQQSQPIYDDWEQTLLARYNALMGK